MPSYGRQRINFDWRGFITPGVKWLVIVCAGVFLVQTAVGIVYGPSVAYHFITLVFGLVPHAITHGLRIWQPFTYIFLHGGLMHLLINMLMLWMFGRELELIWGKRRFLNFFMVCGVGAGLGVRLPTCQRSALPARSSGFSLRMRCCFRTARFG
jgi:membrane associated rhomboid family serine protease